MRVTAVVVAIALLVVTVGAAGTVPDETSLLAAWEAGQRDDPKTTVFERLGERRYRFATERFPFAGELLVLNLSIEALPVADQEVTTGVVEVELVGVDEQFRQRYMHSYGSWAGTHQFYWDDATGRWLDRHAWARQLQGRALGGLGPGAGLAGFLSRNLFWVLFFGFLLGFLGVASRRAGRQMKAAMAAQEQGLAEQRRSLEMVERSLRLGEDSNRVLHEILEELRRGRP